MSTNATEYATEWVRGRLATPPAIYGLIVYEALIATTSDHADSTLEVLLVAATSLVVFYLAHVFAEAVASHGADRLRTAVGRAFRYSAGMLYAAILPTLVLIVCIFAAVGANDASNYAMLAGTLVLGVLGFLSFRQRRAKVWLCVLGGLATALLGLFIMVLDYSVH